MVVILPQPQRQKDTVCLTYLTVAVSTIRCFIILSQSAEAVLTCADLYWRLGSYIAKKFSSVINCSVLISVEDKPGIIRTRRGPGKLLTSSNIVQIKDYSGCATTKTKAITVHVDHYWCVIRNTAAPLETPNPVFTYFRNQHTGRWRIFSECHFIRGITISVFRPRKLYARPA